MDDLKDIAIFNNWIEKSKGYYRYVVASNATYEIVLIYHNLKNDILKATAKLYITGDWDDNNTHISFFSREELYYGTVSECIAKAVEDYNTNMETGD